MPERKSWIESAVDWDKLTVAKDELADQLIHRPLAAARNRGESDGGNFLRRFTQAVSPNPAHNLMGIGIGEKISHGQQTGILCIKFLVRMKFGQSAIRDEHRLPEEVAGFPTDVEEVGIFRRFAGAPVPNPRTRLNPVRPGCSIGFEDPTREFTMAGTFGALVSDANDTFLLSNNHVLADENALLPGAAIFQPGLIDSGDQTPNPIAVLARFQELQSAAKNTVDCAIAKVQAVANVSKEILQIGAPQGSAQAALDMTVHKFGRTTGYTVGQITSVNTDVTLQYERGAFAFTGQILIVGNNGNAFSAAGDSGALVLDRQTNNAVGLLMGGSPTYTVANHIGDVLNTLGITLA